MPPLSQREFPDTLRRVLRRVSGRPDTAPAPPAVPTKARRRRGPSSAVRRQELEAFRRAQGAAYWHYDGRAG